MNCDRIPVGHCHFQGTTGDREAEGFLIHHTDEMKNEEHTKSRYKNFPSSFRLLRRSTCHLEGKSGRWYPMARLHC